MKRKILTVLFSVLAAVCLLFAFVACDGIAYSDHNGNNTGNNEANGNPSGGENTGIGDEDKDDEGSEENNGEDEDNKDQHDPDGNGDDVGEPPHVHEYSVQEVVAATCQGRGYTLYACACGDDYRADFVVKKSHEYSAWEIIQAATENQTGLKRRACKNCGAEDERTVYYAPGDGNGNVPPHVHSYTAKTFAPTCTSDGYTEYVCECGDNYTADYVNPKGHSYGQWQVVVVANCVQEGSEKRVCADCGAEETKTVPLKVHNYAEKIVAPTCIAQGYTEYTCGFCGDHYKTDYVNANGHSYGDWKITLAPTCTKTGMTTRFCACGSSEGVALPVSANHNFDGDSCKDCGYVKPLEASNGLEFELNEDGVSYSVKSCGTATGNIVIPATYKGKPVTKIGTSAFANRDNITSVIVPSSVTYIGTRAFMNCANLKSITLPSSLKTLDTGALWFNPNLTEVIFKGTVSQWKAVNKGSSTNGWNYDSPNAVVKFVP